MAGEIPDLLSGVAEGGEFGNGDVHSVIACLAEPLPACASCHAESRQQLSVAGSWEDGAAR